MNLVATRRSTIVLLIIALAGCATPQRAPELAPVIEVSENTWQQVERDIVAESQAAAGPAKSFARGQMEHWRLLVAQRAEADFIPWFSSYWTQQWLTAKVAWYNLSAGDATDPPVSRLSAYLQAQYFDRVLAPVAKEVDPAAVIGQASKRYIQRLGGQLQPIPGRYGVPREQFERRLKNIPAIALAPPPAHDASLYQLVHADPVDSLPAYAALLRQLREAGSYAGAGLSKTRISPVAKRVSEQLLNRLAISGGTSAATTLIGGVAGTVISIGAAGIGIMLHETKRGEIEAQLRETLNASMDDMWQILMEDPKTGVTTGIYHLSDQIEKSLLQTFTQPVKLAEPPEEIALPAMPSAAGEMIDNAAPDASGDRDK